MPTESSSSSSTTIDAAFTYKPIWLQNGCVLFYALQMNQNKIQSNQKKNNHKIYIETPFSLRSLNSIIHFNNNNVYAFIHIDKLVRWFSLCSLLTALICYCFGFYIFKFYSWLLWELPNDSHLWIDLSARQSLPLSLLGMFVLR